MNRIALLLAVLLLVAIPAPAHAAFLAPLIPIVVGFLKVSALVKLAITIAATVAVSALTRAKKSNRGAGITIEQTLTGGNVSRTFITGLYATAGSFACPVMSHGRDGDTPNAYLTQVILLSDIPVTGLEAIIVNGEYVPFGGAQTEYGVPIGGKYAGHGWIKFYDGTQNAPDSMLLNKYSSYVRPWYPSHIGKGVAYAILTWKYNTEIFKSEPSVRFVVKGIKLYDPRKDGSVGGVGAHRWDNPATWEWSDNNAVTVYNILRGITLPDGSKWGGECQAEDLPLTNWVAAMNVCDENVSIAGNIIESRYRSSYEIKVAEDQPADIIDEFIKACSGGITEVGGIYKMRAGGPGLPVLFLTDDDFIVSREQDYDPFPGLNDSHNGVFATFPHPQEEWNTHDAPAVIDPDYLAQDNDIEIFASISLPTVPYPVQVQRLQRAWLDDDRRWRRHGATLGPYTFVLEPMDTVAWSSTRNGYVNKLFEIAGIEENLMTLISTASMREVDPDDYNWTSGSQLPDPVTPGQWDLPPVQAVPGFAVEAFAIRDEANGKRRPAIRASWNPNGAADATALKIQVRVTVSQAAVADLTVSRIDDGETIISEGILPNQTYEVRARYQVDRPTEWTEWQPVTTENILLNGNDIDGFAKLAEDAATAAAAAEEAFAAAAEAEAAAAAAAATAAALEQDIRDAEGQIVTLSNTVASQGAAISSNATAISNVVGNLASLEVTVGTFDSRITTNSTAVNNLNITMASLETRVSASSPNLLVNANFSNGLDHWAVEGAWQASNDTAVFRNHAYALKSEQPGGQFADGTHIRQWLGSVRADLYYTLSADVRIQGRVSGAAHLAIAYLDASNALIDVIFGPAIGEQDFNSSNRQKDKLTIKPPVGTVAFDVYLHLGDNFDATQIAVRGSKLEIGQTATNFTDEASVTQSFKAINTIDTQVATLSSTVSVQGASIAQNATAINNVTTQVSTLTTQVTAGGGNLLNNSEFANGDLSGWGWASDWGSAVQFGVNIPSDDNWHPFTINAITIHQYNETPGEGYYWADVAGESNKWYEFSIYAAAHRCSVRLDIQFFDINWNMLGVASTGVVAPLSGNTDLNNWSPLSAKMKSPPGTAIIRALIVKYATYPGAVDSWAWFCRPQVAHTLEHAARVPYSPSSNQATVATSLNAIATATTQVATLSSTVSTQGVTISQQMSAISTTQSDVTTLFGKAGLTIDVNGRVTGWSLNNNGWAGTFDVVADRFRITSPSGGARTEYSDGNWRVYDGSGVLRVQLGIW